MWAFDGQGVHGSNLRKYYEYLKSVPSTSVEAKRGFLASAPQSEKE
jgi:hypothetical protein